MLGKAIAGGRQQYDLRPQFSSAAARLPSALVGSHIKESRRMTGMFQRLTN